MERVGIVIKSIDIPKEFPTGFYCRREIAEKSAVRLKEFEEESVFSDIFHIRIFDVNRSCRTKIYLPIYRKPSSKEELVIRFIDYETKTESISQWDTFNKVNYEVLSSGSRVRPKLSIYDLTLYAAICLAHSTNMRSFPIPFDRSQCVYRGKISFVY